MDSQNQSRLLSQRQSRESQFQQNTNGVIINPCLVNPQDSYIAEQIKRRIGINQTREQLMYKQLQKMEKEVEKRRQKRPKLVRRIINLEDSQESIKGSNDENRPVTYGHNRNITPQFASSKQQFYNNHKNQDKDEYNSSSQNQRNVRGKSQQRQQSSNASRNQLKSGCSSIQQQNNDHIVKWTNDNQNLDQVSELQRDFSATAKSKFYRLHQQNQVINKNTQSNKTLLNSRVHFGNQKNQKSSFTKPQSPSSQRPVIFSQDQSEIGDNISIFTPQYHKPIYLSNSPINILSMSSLPPTYSRKCTCRQSDNDFVHSLQRMNCSQHVKTRKTIERNLSKLIQNCSQFQEDQMLKKDSSEKMISKIKSYMSLQQSKGSVISPTTASQRGSQRRRQRLIGNRYLNKLTQDTDENLNNENKEDEVKEEKEIFNNINELQKHLIPSQILKRICRAEEKSIKKSRVKNLDIVHSFYTPQGPLLYRDSSIMKLQLNDSSKYEDSVKDLMVEYKNFAQKSDMMISKKFKFRKFLPSQRFNDN